MSGKGSNKRGSHEAYRNASVWCECGRMKPCGCNESPLPRHPIMDALSEACGYEIRKDQPFSCATCGRELKQTERIVWRANVDGGMTMFCWRCRVSKDKSQ